MFDYVVIDGGRSHQRRHAAALDACQRVYVVLQLTLPFIRDGKRLLDVFRSLDYPASKVRWIVNRHEKGGEISLDDLKRTLNVTELTTLPNQYAVVASSVNQGMPVARLAPEQRHHQGAARSGRAHRAAAPTSRKTGRWLGGLLRGGA
jgi:pilus assembly protein CpaE